ncbi:MAG: geranylgeranylglyceryl/heptaprenylglyceryl phosphate synthase [Brumimicrobium sp.]
MSEKNKNLLNQFSSSKGQIAILIDPEKMQSEKKLKALVEKAHFAKIDYFFVGGSTVSRKEFEKTIAYLSKLTQLPIIIFPGDNQQLSPKANGILYLSLLSGRNPDYLIGQHVASAQEVFNLGLEVIPTAYLLVDGGTKSSVAYVSQTTPIPREQSSIALNTALAGVLQGKKAVYFDAGSGAKHTVPTSFITSLNQSIDCVTIVGGGIRNVNQIERFTKSGVNIIVIGNKIEENIDFLLDINNLNQKVNS